MSVEYKQYAAERRRKNKPIMEKRRRERINTSLETIKTLILRAQHKDPNRHMKMEKADILEMTLGFIRGQLDSSVESTPSDSNREFKIGYKQCAIDACNFLHQRFSHMPDPYGEVVDRLCTLLTSLDEASHTINSQSPELLHEASQEQFPPTPPPGDEHHQQESELSHMGWISDSSESSSRFCSTPSDMVPTCSQSPPTPEYHILSNHSNVGINPDASPSGSHTFCSSSFAQYNLEEDSLYENYVSSNEACGAVDEDVSDCQMEVAYEEEEIEEPLNLAMPWRPW